jgi:hypothetical protein
MRPHGAGLALRRSSVFKPVEGVWAGGCSSDRASAALDEARNMAWYYHRLQLVVAHLLPTPAKPPKHVHAVAVTHTVSEMQQAPTWEISEESQPIGIPSPSQSLHTPWGVVSAACKPG